MILAQRCAATDRLCHRDARMTVLIGCAMCKSCIRVMRVKHTKDIISSKPATTTKRRPGHLPYLASDLGCLRNRRGRQCIANHRCDRWGPPSWLGRPSARADIAARQLVGYDSDGENQTEWEGVFGSPKRQTVAGLA